MFRSRRKRKRKIVHPKAVDVSRTKSNASASQKSRSLKSPSLETLKKNISTKDPLTFSGSLNFENNVDRAMSLASPKPKSRIEGTRRKQQARLLSNYAEAKKITPTEPKAVKLWKGYPVHKPFRAAPLSSQIIGTKTLAAVSETSVANGSATRDTTISLEKTFQYAMAFDTRYLNTPAGKDDQKEFQRVVKDFLQTIFRRRGFSPSVVTWTECSSNHATVLPHSDPNLEISLAKNITICSKPIEDDNIDQTLLNMNGFPIQSPSGISASRLPKGLMANSTWNVFGDLGTYCFVMLYHAIRNDENISKYAVINHSSFHLFPQVDATVDHANPSYAPLKVVIFTSAASFLLDIDSTSHTSGIDAFWNKSQCHFLESRVQSVEIVVVMGETIIDRITKDRNGATLRNDQLSNNIDNEENDFAHVSESDAIGHVKMSASNYEGDRHETNKKKQSSSMTDSLEKETDVFKTIKRHIETKTDADLRINRSQLHYSEISGKQTPVKISLSVIDIGVDFHSLCQKWSRESMHTVTASMCSQTSSMISFELPETIEFDACDVSFATYYKNMPFRVDSSKARMLYGDLTLLSKARLQVLQLVPVPSLDASLIYGVAIGLRALNEDDEESHHEKNYLVQSLFNHLASRDCALLLRSKNEPYMGKMPFRDSTNDDGNDGLFHSTEESQYFLFMPEFVVSKEGPVAPKSGVLHRVTSVDHILEETSASDVLKSVNSSHTELGAEMSRLGSNPFSEYLEASLDSLNCSPLNPWIQDRLNNSIFRSFTIEEQKKALRKSDTLSISISKEKSAGDEDGQVAIPKISTRNENETLSDDENSDSDLLFTDKAEKGSIIEDAAISGSNKTEEKSKLSDQCESNENSKTPNECKTNSKDAPRRTNRHDDKHESIPFAPTFQSRNGKVTEKQTKSRSSATIMMTSTPEKLNNSDFYSSSSSESSFGNFRY